MKSQLFYLFLWLALPLQAQWEFQNSGTTADLNDVYCITADTVVVVGSNATILRTTNGGTTWNAVSNPTNENLYKVQFTGSQTGYATGDNGTLLKTTDAGQTWQSMNTGTTESLLALSCISADTLYVAGTNGLILKSVDGGNNWNNINFSNLILDIYFFNNKGYILVEDSYFSNRKVYKTTDGGSSWGQVFSDIISMKFSDVNFGVCGGAQWLITTNDGFSSFQTQDYQVGNYIMSIEIFNDTIWTSGQNGLTCDCPNYLSKSLLDNGNYITEYADSGDFVANAIDFANEFTGYFVADVGQILKITNGELPSLPTSLETHRLNPVKVYPVPANNTITVTMDDKFQNLLFNIVDAQGRIVLGRQALKENNIDVSSLSAGAYFINFFDSDKIYTQKLIIQK